MGDFYGTEIEILADCVFVYTKNHYFEHWTVKSGTANFRTEKSWTVKFRTEKSGTEKFIFPLDCKVWD